MGTSEYRSHSCFLHQLYFFSSIHYNYNIKATLTNFLPSTGGWVGFFSYDTVRYVEKKKLPFSSAPKDDRNLPDVHLGLYDDVIIFDHVDKVQLAY